MPARQTSRYLQGLFRLLRQGCLAAACVAGGAGARAAATLHAPYGVAVDPTGRIYVANLDGNNVTVYSPQRALVATLITNLNGPVGVGVATDGTVYVANGNNSTIVTYDSYFNAIATFSLPSGAFATGIVVDSVNDIWVLDPTTLHLLVDAGGNLNEIRTTPSYGVQAIVQWSGQIGLLGTNVSGPLDVFAKINLSVYDSFQFFATSRSSFQPAGGAEDAQHRLYKTDAVGKRVVIYDSHDATIVGTVATASGGTGIAVDSLNKRFYVAEPAVNQVAVYSTVAPFGLIGTIR